MNAGVFHLMKAKQTTPIAPQYPLPSREQILKPSSPPLKRSKEGYSKRLSAHGHAPHYVPMDDESVSTYSCLLKTNWPPKDTNKVIGGGTFGSSLETWGCLWLLYVPRLCQYHAPS